MLREMSVSQLYEWIAFYQLEPWGAETLDYQFAHFKALYVNAHLKKGKRMFKPEKFLIFGEKKRGGSPAPDIRDDEEY